MLLMVIEFEVIRSNTPSTKISFTFVRNIVSLKIQDIFLAPVALVFYCITEIRNWFFDKKYSKSVGFNLPVIGIGNLSMGGTGKSPLVEWLLANFRQEFRMAVLSRGYGRKTNGFLAVESTLTVKEAGDEPLLFKWKFPEVPVCLSEDRVVGVPMLLQQYPETEAIVLDDVFQHRAIKPGLMILTTDYENLFTRDRIFPFGWLREDKRNYHRADLIVVTKCPSNLSQEERNKIEAEIKPHPYQRIYFASLEYGNLNPLFPIEIQPEAIAHVLLFTGIANPAPLKSFIESKGVLVFDKKFRDHHSFDTFDLESIKEMLAHLPEKTRLVTTEKDAVRLLPHKDWFVANNIPVFIQPVRHHFLFGDNMLLTNDIRTFIHATIQKNAE